MRFFSAQQAWMAVYSNYGLGPLWGAENMPAEARAVLVEHCPGCRQAHTLRRVEDDDGDVAYVCRSCEMVSPRPHYRRRKGLMRGPGQSSGTDHSWAVVDAIMAAHVMSAIDRLPGECHAWGMLVYTEAGTAHERECWRARVLEALLVGLDGRGLVPPGSWVKTRQLLELVEMVMADFAQRKQCGRARFSTRDMALALLGSSDMHSEFAPGRFWGRYLAGAKGLVDDIDRGALQGVAQVVERINADLDEEGGGAVFGVAV